MLKIIYYFFSFLFLVYLLIPGPSSIEDFEALPNSLKSTLSGDTWQVPNVAGYFSDNYRSFATDYYRQTYQKNTFLPFPPLKLNHPPEYAYQRIKDQTQSTYLEEFYYPFRDAVFVNGYEPFFEDGRPKFWGSIPFEIDGQSYDTKVTVRYYPTSLVSRIITWLGINLSIILLWKLGRKIIIYG